MEAEGAEARKGGQAARTSAVELAKLGRPHVNQFEECETTLREGPRTGDSCEDSGETHNQILGAKPPILPYISPPRFPVLGPSPKLALHFSNWLRRGLRGPPWSLA